MISQSPEKQRLHAAAALTLLCTLAIVFALGGCAAKKTAPEDKQPVAQPQFVAADVDEAESMTRAMLRCCEYQGTLANMQDTLGRSLAYISGRPAKKTAFQFTGGSVAAADSANTPAETSVSWGELAASLEELQALLPYVADNPALLYERFVWMKLQPETLLTGYYEPLIPVSTEKTAEYSWPIYGVPQDLKSVDLGRFHPRRNGHRLIYRMENGEASPYFSREEIDYASALDGKAPVLAWAKDKVDVFFLQVQGSGKLLFPDGSMKHILYNGKNGREYVSIGRRLIAQNLVPKSEMSMQRIRQFLKEHPEYEKDILCSNPSYVFFRLADDGPYGCMGKALTPMRSVAVNKKVIPMGAALILDTDLPQKDGTTRPYTRVVFAQDTGGAITGTRVDLFCGAGAQAEYLAGHLQNPATVYILVSRSVLGHGLE